MARHPKKPKQPRKKGKPGPKSKTILLCERIIVDQVTGTASAIGIFNAFTIIREPGATAPFMVYLHLVGGIGAYEFSMEIIDLKDDTVIARAKAGTLKFSADSRLEMARLAIACPGIPCKKAGWYEFVIYANDDDVERVRFRVNLAKRGRGSIESAEGEEEQTDDQDEGDEEDE